MAFQQATAVRPGTLDRQETVAPVLGVRDFSLTQDGEPLRSPVDGNLIAGVTVVDWAAQLADGRREFLSAHRLAELACPIRNLEDVPDVGK